MTLERSIRGKKNKASGKRFEEKVKQELEKFGFTVSKWNNNIDLDKCKLVQGKPKWNPGTRSLMYTGIGFPDFIAFKKVDTPSCESKMLNFIDNQIESVPILNTYTIMAIESKSNGQLKPIEKAKLNWLVTQDIFTSVLIARKGAKRGVVEFKKWEVSEN